MLALLGLRHNNCLPRGPDSQAYALHMYQPLKFDVQHGLAAWQGDGIAPMVQHGMAWHGA